MAQRGRLVRQASMVSRALRVSGVSWARLDLRDLALSEHLAPTVPPVHPARRAHRVRMAPTACSDPTARREHRVPTVETACRAGMACPAEMAATQAATTLASVATATATASVMDLFRPTLAFGRPCPSLTPGPSTCDVPKSVLLRGLQHTHCYQYNVLEHILMIHLHITGLDTRDARNTPV